MRYPVTLARDTNNTYLVTFPDVPGAVTYGDTKEEALTHAVDALLTVFDALMKDRQALPEPSAPSLWGLAVDVPPLESAKIELYRAMHAGHVNKSELARRLDWHLPQVDRVLNIRHGSQLDQLDAAFRALGKRLSVSVEDLEEIDSQERRRAVIRHRRQVRHRLGFRRAAGVSERTAVAGKAAAKKR